MKTHGPANKPQISTAELTASPSGQRRVPVNDNQIDSRELFTGAREIIIVHGDDTYRLRLTSQNKLILIK